MKHTIEIEIPDDNSTVGITIPTKLLSTVFKTCAILSPRPIDLFFAASFGVVQVLGPKRFLDVAVSGIKATLTKFLGGNKNHAGTNKGTMGSDKKEVGRRGLQDSAKGSTLEERRPREAQT